MTLLPGLTPTTWFWLAIPILGFAFYWLAPWVSSQRKRQP